MMYIAPEKVNVKFSSIDLIAGTGGGTGGASGGTFPGMGGGSTVS